MAEYHHIKLRIKGPPAVVENFHRAMKLLDKDWPWSPKPKLTRCHICGGEFYTRPLLSARDIKNAARQLGVRKLIVERFLPERHCVRKAQAEGRSIFGEAVKQSG